MQNTQLSRVLTLTDITAIGVSCTLGNGIYVLAGDVIANYTGPSIMLSFLIAGLATFVAGLCYAEFGARVPRSGSAYIYIYVTIGEFIAFILGWDLILEYVIGVSSGASALSRYVDALLESKIQNYLNATLHMDVEGFAPYPDFLAFGFVMLITALMVVGVKDSSLLNKLFTALNILVIAFIVGIGSFRLDINNWQIKPSPNLTWTDTSNIKQTCSSSPRCGSGGFAPFGFEGIIQGAAKCFYAYIGFDAISSTGEEVLNPKRNIPISIVITLFIVSLCYISSSIVLTLMIPYYIISPEIPLPQAFDYVGLSWAKYIISAGAIASLVTCLYASMFPMPRVIYSLASDGLIFKFLSYLTPKINTPIMAAVFSGLFAGILVLIFDLSQLIDMLSIGTLMAYSVVAVCILLLRYKPTENEIENPSMIEKSFSNNIQINEADTLERTNPTEPQLFKTKIYNSFFGHSNENFLKRCFSPSNECTLASSHLVNTLTILSTVLIVTLSYLVKVFNLKQLYLLVLTSSLVMILVTFVFIIWKQPQSNLDSFKTPFVPVLPLVSVFINTYLMMALSLHTWMRFGIWFIIGLIVYFSYGMRNSLENKKK